MPLPFPAHNLSPVPIPADRLPKPCPREGVWAPNSLLRQARRLFQGEIVGSGMTKSFCMHEHENCGEASTTNQCCLRYGHPAESVAVAPDGQLWMMDKWGCVRTASAEGDDYRLDDELLAYVGPGRPLGFHHNHKGDLIFCDSLKVTGLWMVTCVAAERASSTGGLKLACAPTACTLLACRAS